MNRETLDKMIGEEAEKSINNLNLKAKTKRDDKVDLVMEFCFKEGANFVAEILMPELDEVKKWMEGQKQLVGILKDEIADLKMRIGVANSDYWFMINLIERYGSDKDQTLKDCLERMKFRKPMFETKEIK